MNRRFFISICALLTFVLTGCNIEGRITSYDGEPMAGVKVSLSGSASLTTRTDSDGYYLFANLNAGRYTVKPALDGYRGFPQSQEVAIDRDDIYGIDFEAEPGNHIRVPRDHDTIQEAVNAASKGDIIWLADGTYSGYGNYDIVVDKLITIQSENGPKNCIIDCLEKGRGFLLTADIILSGVTIINGSHVNGGAILGDEGASPKIFNCTIKGNYAMEAGGGIYTSGGNPRVLGCVISDNKSDHEGGGLCFRSGRPVVSDCTISNNEAGKGGGIFNIGTTVILTESIVRDNQAIEMGGGWYSVDGSHEIERSLFYGNAAGASGAGLYLNDGSSIIHHSTIADNTAENGVGVYVGFGDHTLDYCILWQNTTEQINLNTNTNLNISHAIIGQDNLEGECVINTDPEFAGDGDYYLLEGSPCVDTNDDINFRLADADGFGQ